VLVYNYLPTYSTTVPDHVPDPPAALSDARAPTALAQMNGTTRAPS